MTIPRAPDEPATGASFDAAPPAPPAHWRAPASPTLLLGSTAEEPVGVPEEQAAVVQRPAGDEHPEEENDHVDIDRPQGRKQRDRPGGDDDHGAEQHRLPDPDIDTPDLADGDQDKDQGERDGWNEHGLSSIDGRDRHASNVLF